MKRIMLFVVLALAVVLLAAEPQDVNSIRINGCPILRGDVKLVVKIQPVSFDDESTNTCGFDKDAKAYVLTFYLPEYGYRNTDIQKPGGKP
jgi:hypothetical protein